ncbi:MAG: hypothetical protein KC474_10425 [Cyanobacteria bacterium HKST-UBA04]|nr:hypothetical protein [Cyanobacteria bacterium HKST-UBA04]
MMHVEGSRHVGLGFGAITRQDIAPNTRFRLNEAEVLQQTRLSAEERDQIVRQTQGQVFYTPAEGDGAHYMDWEGTAQFMPAYTQNGDCYVFQVGGDGSDTMDTAMHRLKRMFSRYTPVVLNYWTPADTPGQPIAGLDVMS